MKILAIRHLPTLSNQLNIIQGRTDVSILPVTPETQNQITANRKIIADLEPFNIILTSDLVRTQETAKIYGYHIFKIEPLTNELSFGTYEGKDKQVLFKNFGDRWIKSPQKLTLGEKLLNFELRIKNFLMKYQTFDNILLFAHGAWLRGLVSILNHGNILVLVTF